MNPIGKKIAAIEKTADDEEYIVFTDGTGVETSGWDGGSSFDWLDEDAVKQARIARAERDVKRAQKRLARLEWMAKTCEQRAVILAERKRKAVELKKDDLLVNDIIKAEFAGLMADNVRMQHRLLFGGTWKVACKHCGERECPNATTEAVPPVKVRVDENVPAGNVFIIPTVQR